MALIDRMYLSIATVSTILLCQPAPAAEDMYRARSYPDRATAGNLALCNPPEFGGCNPGGPDFRVYRTDEVDSRLVAQANDFTIRTQGIKDDVEKIRPEVKDAVVAALAALPAQLLTDQLRAQVSAEVVTQLQARIEERMAKVRADLKSELSAEFEARFSAIESRLP